MSRISRYAASITETHGLRKNHPAPAVRPTGMVTYSAMASKADRLRVRRPGLRLKKSFGRPSSASRQRRRQSIPARVAEPTTLLTPRARLWRDRARSARPAPAILVRRWSRLPTWHQQLRILLRYAPPVEFPAPIPSEAVVAAGPSDPAVFPLHSYVYRRFIAPLLQDPQMPGLPPFREAINQLFNEGRPYAGVALGVCLFVIGSPEGFENGLGIGVWPRDPDAETWAPSAKDILDRIAGKVKEILEWQRQGAPDAGPLDYRSLMAGSFSSDKLRTLTGLVDKGVDSPLCLCDTILEHLHACDVPRHVFRP